MTMPDDIHSLSGAYAVDAVDAVERAQFENHLEHCAACREEVASLRAAAAELGALTAEEPPPSLRGDVLDLARTIRPDPPLVSERSRRTRRWGWVIAAAAAVVAVIGVGVTQPWDTSPEQLTVAEQVNRAQDADRVALSFDDGSEATVVRSASVGRAVIETRDMAPPPEGHHYVVWLQSPDGEMHAAGVMPDDESDASMVLRGDATESVGAGITVESDPEVTAPTSEPIALFQFT